MSCRLSSVLADSTPRGELRNHGAEIVQVVCLRLQLPAALLLCMRRWTVPLGGALLLCAWLCGSAALESHGECSGTERPSGSANGVEAQGAHSGEREKGKRRDAIQNGNS